MAWGGWITRVLVYDYGSVCAFDWLGYFLLEYGL